MHTLQIETHAKSSTILKSLVGAPGHATAASTMPIEPIEGYSGRCSLQRAASSHAAQQSSSVFGHEPAQPK